MAAWVAREAGLAIGQLRRRTLRQGTFIHPADLDGVLQLTAMLVSSSAAETRLPFTVGEAALWSAPGRAWPVVERQGANATGVALVSNGTRGAGGARLAGFETRVLKAGAARPAATRHSHLYVTAWQARSLLGAGATAPAAAATAALGARRGRRGARRERASRGAGAGLARVRGGRGGRHAAA